MMFTSIPGDAAADAQSRAPRPPGGDLGLWTQLDSYDSPEAEALLRTGEEWVARPQRPRRELITLAVGAAGFVLAAVLLAVLAPWHRSLSVSTLAIVLVVWVIL